MAHCCRVECARDYSVAAINASARQWWLPPAEQRRAEHVSVAAAALAQCQGSAELLQSGGWCLGSGKRHRKRTPVPLANGQTYLLPGGHYAADDVVVAALDRLLRPAGGDGGGRYQSLLDLGAGVGQYGHQLPALDARHRYSGYDGAGGERDERLRRVRGPELRHACAARRLGLLDGGGRAHPARPRVRLREQPARPRVPRRRPLVGAALGAARQDHRPRPV